MISLRQLFLNNVAQTSDEPILLEIVKASGIHLYDNTGKAYIDLISGISVSNIGHCHPKVVEAVKKQAEKYMYLMVYGEYVQSPQVQLAKLLTSQLPGNLQQVYYCNSGAEATEGAIKLARKFTGKTEIIHFEGGYHGSTIGALSVIGDEYFKTNYRPLPPGTRCLKFNCEGCLNYITKKTAGVIVEPVQGEPGVIAAKESWLKALRKKCDKTGTLLIFDEIQSGFGRSGSLFAFQQYNVIPDVLNLAKGMGGGMPMAAFVASAEIMSVFKSNPFLGHITTFGGHPVCCAAAIASLNILLESGLIAEVKAKEQLFLSLLKHPAIKSINHKGLWMALEFENFEQNKAIIDQCIANGIITDWFLFSDKHLRIAPPLIITNQQIEAACAIIIKSINAVTGD